jgi:uncharacterized damage-inducible protein DinB
MMMNNIEPIAALYRINTDLFRRTLNMGNSLDPQKRPFGKGNSFHWLVGHLTTYRFFAARLLGIDGEFPNASLFEYGADPADPTVYPSLDQIQQDWEKVTPKLLARLEEVPDEVLAEETSVDIPGVEKTVGALVSFLQLHESYHIGQLACIIRLQGGERLMG